MTVFYRLYFKIQSIQQKRDRLVNANDKITIQTNKITLTEQGKVIMMNRYLFHPVLVATRSCHRRRPADLALFCCRYVSSGNVNTDHNDRESNSRNNVIVDHNNTRIIDNEIILFQRNELIDTSNQNRSILFMRGGLIFSCFHTLYWIWYTTVFIPLVNSSQFEYLHISESIGLSGIALASTIQSIFFYFPYRMVSKMTFRPSEHKIYLYTYQIPWIRPSTKSSISFSTSTSAYDNHIKNNHPTKLDNNVNRQTTNSSPVGFDTNDEISIRTKLLANNASDTTGTIKKPDSTTKIQKERSLLDPTSEQAKYILHDLNGDLTVYSGNIPIGYKWPYYLLDIQTTKNIPEPDL